MNLLWGLYVLILFHPKRSLLARGENLSEEELKFLAKMMSPHECSLILQKINVKKSFESSGNREETDGQLENEKNCLLELEEWNKFSVDRRGKDVRPALILALKSLGRPDLVRFLKKDRTISREIRNFLYPELFNKNLQDAQEVRRVLRGAKHSGKKETPGAAKGKKGAAKKKSKQEKKEDVEDEDEEDLEKTDDSHSNSRIWAIGGGICGGLLLLASAIVFLKWKMNDFYWSFGKKVCSDECPWRKEDDKKPLCDCEIREMRRQREVCEDQDTSQSDKSCCTASESTDFSQVCVHERENERRKRRRKKMQKKLKKIKKEKNRTNKSFGEISQQIDLRDCQDKIVHILRKQFGGCECCKCSPNVGEEESGKMCKLYQQKGTCTDRRCRLNVARKIIESIMKDSKRAEKRLKVRKKRKLKNCCDYSDDPSTLETCTEDNCDSGRSEESPEIEDSEFGGGEKKRNFL